MTFEPKSIAEEIESLAKTTGASAAFTDQVKELFERKGISLDTASAPYARALKEAFRREETIRTSSWRAKQQVNKLDRDFTRVGEAYVKQVSQLKRLQSNLKKRANAARSAGSSALDGNKKFTHAVTIQGDHRSYVTKPQREDQPLVPGPKDIQ